MVDWESFYAELRRPDFVPGFQIQNHLGGGAFGEVYKAERTSIGKAYAIKFLRLDAEEGRGAIERELDSVRLFASIDHPNLVTIEDMGVAGGVPYVVMGYAGKETLARRLQERALETGPALRYFVQACRGVLALHDLRLAHFDLKPSNIFLRGDVARVGDYGLAKLLTEGRSTLSFGRGTPRYMAPEMLRSRADHRADIYSLGVILFESFAFALPFETERDPGTMGLLVRDRDDPPDFPAGFPGHLVDVVTRCLRLDPEDRYASVTELLAALGQTARPGDSVRLRRAQLPAETRALQMEEPLTYSGREGGGDAAGRESPTPAVGELRSAAAELARGAADVARGMWDGVALRREPSAEDSDVVVFQTLDDPDEPAPEELEVAAAASALGVAASADPGDERAPWRRELERERRLRRGEPTPGPLPQAGGRPLAFATVPVPPASTGGLVGSVLQCAVVGVEILGALVSGPAMAGLRGVTGVLDRLLGGVPAPLEKLLRFLLSLVFLALLGAAVVAVFLVSMAARS